MYFVQKFLICTAVLFTFFLLTALGFSFGKKKCEEECGGEKAHDEILLKGEMSCYLKKFWMFGIKDGEAATECEIKSCKLGYGKKAENQTECWCAYCQNRAPAWPYGKDDFCFGIGEGVLDREGHDCHRYFCHTYLERDQNIADVKPVYFYGKYCNKKYKHLAQ